MIRQLDYNSEVYNQRANEYDTTGAKEESISPEDLITDLKDSLAAIEDKAYLCANEIGLDVRAFCVRFDTEFKVFINPMFQEKNEIKLIREKDYATNTEYIIPRFTDSVICYQQEDYKVVANKVKDDASIILNQAMDCLDGIHDYMYGLEIIPEFDKAPEEERTEVVQQYLNSLQEMYNNLDQELRTADDIKDEWNYYRFLKAKAEGQIETIPDVPKMNRAQRRSMRKFINRLKRRKK